MIDDLTELRRNVSADIRDQINGSYESSYRLPDPKPIYEFAKESGIQLDASSPLSGSYEIENSLYMRDQLLAFQDEDTRMVTSIGPNQGGRTKAMEVASLWCIEHRPGPMQWNTDTNDKAKDFAEERWWQMARTCRPVISKLPSGGTGLGAGRFQERTRKVIFTDGMPFVMQGCTDSNLEQKSVLNQFNDECWNWPVGQLEKAHIRCNVAYAWNYKVWNGSVAGNDGDDIHNFFEAGTQEEWHWRCLKCGRPQLPIWGKPKIRGGVRWETDAKTRPNGREWDYDEVRKTVRYECIHCKEDFADSARIRRLLNESARYIALNKLAPRWHRSFRFNILTVNWPGLSWGKWVEEFLRAVDKMQKIRVLEPLKTFWTRRMAEGWDESRHASATRRIVISDYKLADADGANQWRTKQWDDARGKEVMRFLSCDKQTWGYPFVIRSVAQNGDSRLIDRGVSEKDCLTSYTEIDEKAKSFGVNPVCVLIDSGFEASEVYAQAVNYGWTCMRGVDRKELFKHKREIIDTQTKQRKIITVELPYSEEKWADPFLGTEEQVLNRRMGVSVRQRKLARRFDWINLHIKNLADAFKKGQGIYWGLPEDVGAEYIRQLNAEVRHRIMDARQRATEWWSNTNAKGTGKKRPNHAWDIECQIVVAECLQGLIDLGDWNPEASPPEEE